MRAQHLSRRRWHVLDDGILAYGLALLRTLWLWPLLHLTALSIDPDGRDFLAPWLILGLLAGGTLVAQIVSHWGSDSQPATHTSSRVGRTSARPSNIVGGLLAGLCGLAAVLAAVYFALGAGQALPTLAHLPSALAQQPGRAFTTLVLAAGLWWWGLRAGSESITYGTLSRNFLIGLVGLLFVLGLNAAAQLIVRAALLGLLLTYLAVGLFLLALASIQATRLYERVYGEHDLSLPSHWWATVGAVVAVLLFAALVLSWLFVPETLGSLAAAVALVLALLGQVIVWLIMIVSYPVIMLLAWLAGLLTMRPFEGQVPELMPPPAASDPLSQLADQAGAPVDPTIWWSAAGVLAIAAIVLLFVLAVRRHRSVAEDDVAETHEGILTIDLLKAQLAELLRRRRTAVRPAPYLTLAGDDPATRVRRTYQQLLAWAAANGHARAPAMTPDGYRDVLTAAYPAQGADFAAITAAYTVARYSPGLVPDADAERAVSAWQQILAAGQSAPVADGT
jgi:hypothetical protein